MRECVSVCAWTRSHSRGLDFVAGGAHPSRVVRQRLAFFAFQTRLHLAPPLPDDDGRIHTGGLVARRPGHLPRQTGALDRLRSLLDAILVAAPVGGDHLAGSSLQSDNVGAAGPGHMVLLDGLVECGLAQQQEAQANPHGQEPGHGVGHVCS